MHFSKTLFAIVFPACVALDCATVKDLYSAVGIFEGGTTCCGSPDGSIDTSLLPCQEQFDVRNNANPIGGYTTVSYPDPALGAVLVTRPPTYLKAKHKGIKIPMLVSLHAKTLDGWSAQGMFDDVAVKAHAIQLTIEGPTLNENRIATDYVNGDHYMFPSTSDEIASYTANGVTPASLLAKIRKIVIDTLKEYESMVDLTRVYVMGWSQGGYVSYLLAHHCSDIFAAIVSLSGHNVVDYAGDPYNKASLTQYSKQQPVHVMHIHGSADDTVYAKFQDAEGNFWGARKSVEDFASVYVDAASLTQYRKEDAATIPKYQYVSSIDATTLEILATDDEGYVWKQASHERTRYELPVNGTTATQSVVYVDGIGGGHGYTTLESRTEEMRRSPFFWTKSSYHVIAQFFPSQLAKWLLEHTKLTPPASSPSAFAYDRGYAGPPSWDAIASIGNGIGASVSPLVQPSALAAYSVDSSLVASKAGDYVLWMTSAVSGFSFDAEFSFTLGADGSVTHTDPNDGTTKDGMLQTRYTDEERTTLYEHPRFGIYSVRPHILRHAADNKLFFFGSIAGWDSIIKLDFNSGVTYPLVWGWPPAQNFRITDPVENLDKSLDSAGAAFGRYGSSYIAFTPPSP